MNQKLTVKIAAILFGLGLGLGVLPIILASILVRKNLFIESIDRMDNFWKELTQ